MPVVHQKLETPDGTPITAAWAEFRLFLNATDGAAYDQVEQSEVFPVTRVRPDSDGLVSITLRRNSAYDPDNTYYQVAYVVTGQVTRYETFVVPDDTEPDGGFWIKNILVVPPTNGDPPGDPYGTAAAAIAAHLAAGDPHPVYDTAAEVTTALAAHAALSDPHPGYLTPAEGSAAYDAIGAAAAAVATHVGLADPHPQYFNAARGAAAFDAIGAAAAALSSASSALATHEADTTNIHGIANTADLARLSVAQTFTAKQTISAPISADRSLDLNAPQDNGMQAVFNRRSPPVQSPQAFWNIGSMIGSQGQFLSNAWMVLSGTAPGSPNAAGIYEPQQPSSDQFMLGIWSDIVGPALVTRTNPTSTPGYNYQAHDRNGNYTFSVEEDGTLKWGAGNRAAMDASLYRSAASLLRTPGSLAIDTLLSFPTSGTRSLITARNQGNTNTSIALSVDASNNLVFGDPTTNWAGILYNNRTPLTMQGSASTGWQPSALMYGGDANNNSGATQDLRTTSALQGMRLYGGRWSSTDRGGRLVAINSAGAEKVYGHFNAEGGTVSFGTGIGSTGGNGTDRLMVSATSVAIEAATPLAWGASGFGAFDLALYRDAANVLGQRNATNPQALEVYTSFVDVSNYGRLVLDTRSSSPGLYYERAGSVGALDMYVLNRSNAGLSFGTNGNTRWSINNSAGHLSAQGGNWNIWNGTSALATTATAGFLGVNSCAGTPTGVPASPPTGQIPLVFDSVGLKLYAWVGGAWKASAAFT